MGREGGVMEAARTVSAIACAFADAVGDLARLQSTITQSLADALDATCALYMSEREVAQSGDPSDELGAGRIEISLRRHEVELGTLRITRRAAFTDQEHELAELIAAHAAIVIANARSRAELEHVATAAATARRNNLARFAQVFQGGALGVIVTTIDGRIRDINDALTDLIGYSRDEVLAPGFSWVKLTPPEWHPPDARALEELRITGVASLREKQYIRKDGTRIWVMVGSNALDGSSGEVLSFVVDVTARKNAERDAQRLREERDAAERLRALVETAPDALVIVGADGKIALVNARAERLFGYPRSELLEQPAALLIPGGLSGPGEGIDLVCRRKDGTETPVEVNLAPLANGEGTMAAIRDIAERKRAEETRARLAAIVDSSDDAIIGKTLDGVVTSWNHGAERLFGYTAAEMRGRPVAILIPAGREHEEPELLAHLRRGEVTRFDTVRRRKDGSEIAVSVTSSPTFDATGRLIGASKVARDITTRRAAELALAHARDAAETANRELESFSYSVAHDLRAPLRAINGFAKILVDDYAASLDGEAREYLDDIQAGAATMAALIDALLSLSRVTRSELHREATDVAALVHATARELAAAEPGRHVEVVAASPLDVVADPRLMRVLVTNLIGNAWKFSAKVANPRIEVGTDERDGARVIYVRDNGAGFDMAHAKNLFAPFQRLHTVREFPGTGIGLATVQRIVHRHGGRIWAEGAVDAGATFYFSLQPSELRT